MNKCRNYLDGVSTQFRLNPRYISSMFSGFRWLNGSGALVTPENQPDGAKHLRLIDSYFLFSCHLEHSQKHAGTEACRGLLIQYSLPVKRKISNPVEFQPQKLNHLGDGD